jgi:hypothetical protein
MYDRRRTGRPRTAFDVGIGIGIGAVLFSMADVTSSCCAVLCDRQAVGCRVLTRLGATAEARQWWTVKRALYIAEVS